MEEKMNKHNQTSCMYVPVNDVVMEIVEGIGKLVYDPKFVADSVVKGVRACTRHNSEISVVVRKFDKSLSPQAVQRIVRPSTLLVFIYILACWKEQQSDVIDVDIKKYFQLRGVKRRKENVDRFIEDLRLLAAMEIGVHGKVKRQTYVLSSELLTLEMKERKVQVRLGVWAKKIDPNKVTMLHSAIFSKHSKHQMYLVMLSLKFAQLCKVNRKKGDKHVVKMNTLLQFIGIPRENVTKRGYTYYLNLFNSAFAYLQRVEGYSIAVSPVKSADDFVNAVIEYKRSLSLYKK